MEAEWPMEPAAKETMEAKLPMEPAAKEPDSPDSENDDRWEFTFYLLRSFILLFLSRPAAEARAPKTTQGQAAPNRPKRKLTKKSSTFLDKSSLKKRNRRGNAISWVEAFKFKNREEYEDSDVYKDKISNLKTRDKGGRPYKVYYCAYARKTGYSPCSYALRVTETLEGEVVVEGGARRK